MQLSTFIAPLGKRLVILLSCLKSFRDSLGCLFFTELRLSLLFSVLGRSYYGHFTRTFAILSLLVLLHS